MSTSLINQNIRTTPVDASCGWVTEGLAISPIDTQWPFNPLPMWYDWWPEKLFMVTINWHFLPETLIAFECCGKTKHFSQRYQCKATDLLCILFDVSGHFPVASSLQLRNWTKLRRTSKSMLILLFTLKNIHTNTFMKCTNVYECWSYCDDGFGLWLLSLRQHFFGINKCAS